MIAGLTLALGSVANAQQPAPPAPKINWSPTPAIDISDPHKSIDSPYGQRNPAVDRHGAAQTAIGYQFSPAGQASVGYLCGLQPGPNESGGPASTFDPEGTFLGGQFKLAFK
jgi:hypothetical protein